MLQNFRTYQLSLDFYRQCRGLQIKGSIRDQLERASLSICLNLAEGCAKQTVIERRKFYRISYGSLKESQCILEILDSNNMLQSKADLLGAHLFKLIKALE
jgi:four helix bundle protein